MSQNPHPPQQRYPHSISRGYPYNAQSHTHLSPGGMNYPAPTPYRSVSDPDNHPPPPIPALHSTLSPTSPYAFSPLHSHPERPHSTGQYPLRQGHDIPPHLPLARATSYSPSPAITHHPASVPNPPLRRLSTADLADTSRSASPPGSASSAPAWRGGRVPRGTAHNDGKDGMNPARSTPKGGKGRTGGPPKAKLGGPGGKTFDEMLAAGEVQARKVSPSPITPTPQATLPVKEDAGRGREGQGDTLSQIENTGLEGIPNEALQNNEKRIETEPVSAQDISPSKPPKLAASEPITEQHSAQQSDPNNETPGSTAATANVQGGVKSQISGRAMSPDSPRSGPSEIPSLSADETDNPWDAPLEGSLAGFEQLVSAERAAYLSHGSKSSTSSGQELLFSPGKTKPRQANARKPKPQADARSVSSGRRSDGGVQPDGSSQTTRPRGLAGLPPKPEFSGHAQKTSSRTHPVTSPKTTKRSRDEQPARDVTPLSPLGQRQEGSLPEPKTIREPGTANSAFLRKTLAGMLRGNKETEERKAVRRSRQSNPSVSSLVSEPATATHQPASGHDGEDKHRAAGESGSVREDAEVSTLSSVGNTPLDMPAQLEIDDALPKDATHTITPAKSKRIAQSLQRSLQSREEPLDERGPHTAGTMELSGTPVQAGDTGSEGQVSTSNEPTDLITSSIQLDAQAPLVSGASDGLVDPGDLTPEGEVAKQGRRGSSEPQPIKIRPTTPDPPGKLQADQSQVSATTTVGEAPILLNRPESAASSKDQSANLRPDASTFVPSATLQPSHSLADAPKSTVDEGSDERAQKRRAKLRPSAAAFVPRPASTRRHLLPPHVASASPAGSGIVPDTFAFAPVLPSLLPSGHHVVPHFPQPFIFGQNVPGPMRATQAAFNRPSHLPAGVPGYIPPSQILLGQARHPQVARPPIGHPADFVPGSRVVSATASFHPTSSGNSRLSLSGGVPSRLPTADVSLTGMHESAQRQPREAQPPDDVLRSIMPFRARPTSIEASRTTIPPLAAVLNDHTAIKPLSLGDIDRNRPPLPSDTLAAGPQSRASDPGGRAVMITIDETETGAGRFAQSPPQLSLSAPEQTVHAREAPTADDTLTSAEDSPPSRRRLTPRLSPLRYPSGLPLRVGSSSSPRTLPQSPSPMLLEDEHTPGQPAATFADTEINVDPAADDRRFREWVYPSGGEHRSRPSISRRHTMPTELQSLGEPPSAGIASTFSTRVHGLRQILARGSLGDDNAESGLEDSMARRKVSTQSSAEFPLRRERKTLTVVNGMPGGDESPGGIPPFESPAPMDLDARIDVVLQTLRRIELGGQDRRPVEASVATNDGSVVGKIEQMLEQTRQTMSTLSDENKELASMMRITTAQEDLIRRLEKHSSMLESLTDISAAPHSHQGMPGDMFKRTEDILEAVAAGQSGIKDQIAKSFDNYNASQSSELRNLLESLRTIQDETAGVIGSIRAAQPQVDELRRQLLEANDAHRTTKLEHEHAKTRLSALEEDARRVREEKASVEEQLRNVEAKEMELREQVDKVLSGRTAAEQERDALSEALRARMTDTERLDAELERIRTELLSHKEKAGADQENAKSLEAISAANTAFHEEILSRMARLDEGMHESMGSRVKEYEAVLDRNKVLQSEVDGLRAKLESSMADVLSSKTESEREVSGHKIALADLETRLQGEMRAREESERRGGALEKELEKARAERENALLVANERASWARMTEVRIQAMAQECVYWRQFALESDRKKYRAYIASSPFRGPEGTPGGMGENGDGVRGGSEQSASSPEAQITTPKQTPEGLEGKARVDEAASPLHTYGVAHPLMASTSSVVGDGEVKSVSENPEGRLWNAA